MDQQRAAELEPWLARNLEYDGGPDWRNGELRQWRGETLEHDEDELEDGPWPEELRRRAVTEECINRSASRAGRINLASVALALVAAWILTAWLCPVAAAGNVLTEGEKIFIAYDCSLPSNVTSVSLSGNPEECSEQQLRSKQKKVTYNLLQKTERVRLTMYNARARYSRIIFVCGAATHSSIASREWLFNMPYPLTRQDHRELWGKREFRRPHWQPNIFKKLGLKRTEWDPVPLEVGKTVQFAWDVVGGTMHNGNDVYCQGQSLGHEEMVSFKKKTLKEAVMTYLMEVRLDELTGWYYLPTAAEPKGYILVEHGQNLGTVRLPASCTFDTYGCVTKEYGTYEWGKYAGPVCPYFRVKQTTGIDVPTTDIHGEHTGTATFVSTDNAMIRLEKKGKPQPACGGIVQPTTMDSLYLTSEVDRTQFNVVLQPEEASAYLYSAVSDFFIHEKLQDDLERAVLQLQRHECNEDLQVRHRQLARKAAEQQALSEGGTAHLGGGRFFTARGDAGFVYTCRELQVVAKVPDGRCFNSLGVDLLPAEQESYKRIFAEEQEDDVEEMELPNFYLEPKTHRLLTTAAEEQCLDDLAPMYQNKRGNWVSIQSSALSLAIPPVSLESGSRNLYEYQRRPIDVSEGGLYERSLLKKIHSYLQTRNVEFAVLGSMNQHYRGLHNGRTFSPSHRLQMSDFYPDAPSVDALTVITSMNWVWYTLVQYWRVATIILASIMVFRIGRYCLASCVRLCAKPDSPSPALHVVSAFCPDLAFFCKSGRYRPNGPHGPFREVFAACATRRDLATPDVSDDDEVMQFRRQKQKRQLRRQLRQAGRRLETTDGESENLGGASVDLPMTRQPRQQLWRNHLYPDIARDTRRTRTPPPSAMADGQELLQDAEAGQPNQAEDGRRARSEL